MQSSWRTHSFAFHPPTHDGTLPARRQDDGHPGNGGCRQIEEPWQWKRHGRGSGNIGSDINCRCCRGCVSGNNSEAADNRAHLPLSKCTKMDRRECYSCTSYGSKAYACVAHPFIHHLQLFLHILVRIETLVREVHDCCTSLRGSHDRWSSAAGSTTCPCKKCHWTPLATSDPSVLLTNAERLS